MKKPEGKYKPHLIYQSMSIAVCRQREYGINKHGSVDGWKTTTTMEHLDAAKRHIDEAIEAVRNEDVARLTDPDSGQLHYAAAICNLMFEIERLDGEKKQTVEMAGVCEWTKDDMGHWHSQCGQARVYNDRFLWENIPAPREGLFCNCGKRIRVVK